MNQNNLISFKESLKIFQFSIKILSTSTKFRNQKITFYVVLNNNKITN